MPGLLDFLGGLFGGGQQQAQPAQAGGLTDPALYAQQPPEFKLPFAYKLAMLGSSINRGYGGRGGIDVGSLAEAYMKNQQDQYTWQTEQAEKKRKLDLLNKYLDKSGNQELKDLAAADPDAALKLVFGIEAEKAKPDEGKVVGGRIIGRDGKVLYEPPPEDFSYLSGGEPAGAATAEPATVPSTGAVRAGSGDRAPDAAVTATTVPAPVESPVSASGAAAVPGVDLTGLSTPAVTHIQTVIANRDRSVQVLEKQRAIALAAAQHGHMNGNEYAQRSLAIQTEIDNVNNDASDDILGAAERDRAAQAAEKTAEAERKSKAIIKVSPGETVLDRSDPTKPPQVIYKAQQNDNTDIANAKFLANPDVPEEQKKALREAMRSGTPLPPPVADQLAVIDGKLRIEGAHKLADGLLEEGNKTAPILGTLKTIETLIPGATGGVLKDPNALAAAFVPGWNKNADVIKKSNAFLAPQLRVVGSGSSSDPDVALNLESLSSWKDSPEVNAAITAMAIGRFQIAKDRADAAMQYNRGKLSMDDFYVKLQEINNRDITPQLIKDMLSDGRLKRDDAAPVAPAGSDPNSITSDLETLKKLKAGKK